MKPRKKKASLRTAAAAPPNATPPVRGVPGLSKGRQWCFRLVAMFGVTLLFFVLLEAGLRWAGFGYATRFLIPSPVSGRDELVENPEFSRRYFPIELKRLPRPVAFSPVKPPDTLRVFVFGESAAEGDPVPAFGFARILEVLLRDRFPGRNVELINTSVTAINSHVIRPIARECAAYSGDVWVIYMGNNEVIGPFGSGTVFGRQAPPRPLIRANLALKSTRTGQLLEEVLGRVGQQDSPRSWTGMELFLGQHVHRDDPRMEAVRRHFGRNLEDMIQAGVRSGAKIVVSTVGVNLRDCPPFGSLHRADLTADAQAEWETIVQEGITLEDSHRSAEAVARYQAALRVDDTHAELHFRLARCLAALGRMEEAGRHFSLARDCDTLRFRTDSRLNEAIRRLATAGEDRGVRLADVEDALARASQDGLTGKQWFLEHVHLTFSGNYLVARTVAEQVVRSVSAEPLGGGNETAFLSENDCAWRLGLTDFDRWQMAEHMMPRTSRPPFTGQLDHAADTLRRQRDLTELRERDRTNFATTTAIFREALARSPEDWMLHDHFAGALLDHGDLEGAAEHWRHATRLLPHRLTSYDLLGSVLFELGRWDEADACYQELLRLHPSSVEGHIGLGRVRLSQRRGEEAIHHFQRAVTLEPSAGRARNHLGLTFLQLGRTTEAEAVFRETQAIAPDFMPARLNLGSTLLSLGRPDDALAHLRAVVQDQPADASARLALGRALAKQGQMAEAAWEQAEAVRLRPRDFEARQILANSLIRLNRLAEATEHLVEALRLRPNSAECRLNYGIILASRGKTAEARAQLQEAVRLRPDLAPAHLNLAVAFIEENRWSQAVVHLRETLRLEPGNAHARQLLESAPVRP